MRVHLPPLDELAANWHLVAPLLHKATRRTGCYEPIDLLALAMAGRAVIWLCESEPASPPPSAPRLSNTRESASLKCCLAAARRCGSGSNL